VILCKKLRLLVPVYISKLTCDGCSPRSASGQFRTLRTSFEMKEAPTEAGLLGWRARIEKLRNSSDELRWRERLRQHDAVRDAPGCPIVSLCSGHVNDGKVRIDFSSVSCDVPPVELSRTQIDVRDKRSVFAFGSIKQLDGVFSGRRYDNFESSLAQAVLDNALNKLIVFNDQDKELVFHSGPLSAPQGAARVHALLKLSFRRKCTKVLISQIRPLRRSKPATEVGNRPLPNFGWGWTGNLERLRNAAAAKLGCDFCHISNSGRAATSATCRVRALGIHSDYVTSRVAEQTEGILCRESLR